MLVGLVHDLRDFGDVVFGKMGEFRRYSLTTC